MRLQTCDATGDGRDGLFVCCSPLCPWDFVTRFLGALDLLLEVIAFAPDAGCEFCTFCVGFCPAVFGASDF